MNSDPARVEQLLNEALQRANHIERHIFLTGACGNDTALWNEVWDRLRNHTSSLPGRQRRTRGIRISKAPSPGMVEEKPGDMIGPYRLLQIIDEDVCSTLWMAERNQRVAEFVAIKIVAAAANDFLIRYEAQKHSLALLDHPAIARPHACGMTPGGRPYLVTELLHGSPITHFCDDQKLSLLARVRLFIQVCDAVHNAHQRGVVHGDLKPSNLLVKWGDQGEPMVKVADFGIAKAMDYSLLCPNGQLRTAAAYLSPEHVTKHNLDARSDIYALGMLLYELITGRLPIPTPKDAAEHVDEVKRLVCETPPLKPSECLRALPRAQIAGVALGRKADPATYPDLLAEHFDWIVMRTLEKRPENRYSSLEVLENDFMAYLKDAAAKEEQQPTVQGTAFGSFISEHRGLFALAAVLVLLLTAGTLLAGWLLLEQKKEKVAVATRQRGESHSMTSRFLQEMFGSLTQENVKGKDTTLVKQMLDSAVDRLDTLADNPEAGAKVQETLGLTYLALSQPLDAQKQLEGALEKRLLALGGSNRETLRTMRELAEAMQAEGRYADAETLLRRTLTAQQKALGPDHPDTFVTITILAAVCDAQDKHADSETLLLGLYQVQKRVLGPDHLDTFATLGQLAQSYTLQGRHAEALKKREEQLEGTRRVLGPTDPRTLVTMNITAQASEKGGMPSDAEKLYFQALDIMKQTLGAEHPDTLVQMDQAALLLGRRGRHAEALRMHHQGLDAKRRVLGLKHPQTWSSMRYLADEFEAQGRQAECESAQAQVLEIMKTAFPPEHPEILAQMDTVSQVYDNHGRHGEAVKLRKEALSMRLRSLGSTDATTLRTMKQLAASLDADGQHARAMVLQLEMLDIMKTAYGPGDPDTLTQMRAVASVHDRHGDHAQAEKMYSELLQIQQRVLGVSDAETLATMAGLAATLQHAGRLTEAEALYTQVLELQRKRTPEDPAAVAAAAADLSALWVQMSQHAKAEPLLRHCLELYLEQKPQAETWMRYNIESLLGEVLVQQKSFSEAGTLLHSGYHGLSAETSTLPKEQRHHLRAAILRLVQFSEVTGNTAKAAEWRQKLTEFDQPPAHVPNTPKLSMSAKQQGV
ncbi:serine/threonine-protein kinase [Prosthecobacter vanneervenii]|uniref:Serine/threonine protein kinase n=1 Tax=Prosthecobacter vanneervenii TaxID=48466 RepID=A0A7W7YEC1_9BACT|nr:serine/threonine-protein kinase [Prosthecobacter vanneervenii]MBB5034539.1 serine/threonine protein kinase [Prosthecobacter vanneervenii]